MKITDLLLEQQGPSKAIINSILVNSSLENSPSKDQIINDITTKYYPRFKQIQNGLKLGIPQVDTFLRHFSGNHDTIKFESDLKDITKYNVQQLKFLIGEYTTKPQGGENDNPQLLNKTTFNEETAEISKKLWYDESTAIISLPGFRVYQPMNQSDAVKFGWYEEKLLNEIRPGWHSWCITWRTKTNRWGTYREDGGTFYFIIDESKLQSEDSEVKKYYLCALQVISKKEQPDHPTGYELTDIKNPGEVAKNWNFITALYPQLSEHRDVFKTLNFNNDELEAQDTVAKINEREGDRYEFARMERTFKKQYIDSGLKLQKPHSWDFMDQDLRAAYISLTEKGDFRTRFPNFEILRAVKKYGLGNLLNSEMIKKEKNEGIKSLTEYLLKDLDVLHERSGIVNESIFLYKTNRKKYGLWNNLTSDWLEKNGTSYDASYNKTEEEVIENTNTKERFYVDKYSINDNEYFVAITPLLDMDSYFLSKTAWEGIKDKFKTEGTELDADSAQDINEFKKGL